MTDNQKKLILEAYRRSEERLRSQKEMAIAADQRAMTFAGFMIAAATVLGGFAFSATIKGPIIFTSALLIVSAFLAVLSASPAQFGTTGGKFTEWKTDVDEDIPFEFVLKQVGGFQDEDIEDNEVVMSGNAKLMNGSIFFAIASIIPLIFAFLFPGVF